MSQLMPECYLQFVTVIGKGQHDMLLTNFSFVKRN